MNQKPKQDLCSVYERRGQLVLALNCEKIMSENAPVRLVSAVLEELNYEALYRAYSPRGRKSAADLHWYTDTCAGSLPATNWKRPAGTAWTSCGCLGTRKYRITVAEAHTAQSYGKDLQPGISQGSAFHSVSSQLFAASLTQRRAFRLRG